MNQDQSNYFDIERQHYEEKRRQAIVALESLNLDVIPLNIAAAALPVNPEWARYCSRRRGRPKKSI